LACPTHRGGWIDPRDLVRRLKWWQEALSDGTPRNFAHPDKYDVIQALLRLAPDYRAEALGEAGNIQGEAGAAVRFALGADEPIGRQASLWIAAARARDPWGSFQALADIHGSLGPDAAVPAVYEWDALNPDPTETWRAYPSPRLRVYVEPPVLRQQLQLDRPTALLNSPFDGKFAFDTILNIRCRCAVWPANPDASFREGAMAIVTRLDDPPSTLSPTAQYLEPLFDGDTRFSEMAQLALAVALLAKDAGKHGLAIDTRIMLAEDGRCMGDTCGPVYGTMM
jgi:hypothetical protein